MALRAGRARGEPRPVKLRADEAGVAAWKIGLKALPFKTASVSAETRAPAPARHASPRRGAKLQDRIVVFFVVLLMGVQLASFYFIRYAIERTAQDTLRNELRVGARVFRRLLDQNSAAAGRGHQRAHLRLRLPRGDRHARPGHDPLGARQPRRRASARAAWR